MQEFPKGVRSDTEKAAYQDWIREHPRGLILNKAGNTYTLHSASCPSPAEPARTNGNVDLAKLVSF